jgi:hypothetical protein
MVSSPSGKGVGDIRTSRSLLISGLSEADDVYETLFGRQHVSSLCTDGAADSKPRRNTLTRTKIVALGNAAKCIG